MPSSPLRTQLRIRRNAQKIGNIFLRADEGIGPYIGCVIGSASSNLQYHRTIPSGTQRQSDYATRFVTTWPPALRAKFQFIVLRQEPNQHYGPIRKTAVGEFSLPQFFAVSH